jgi:PhnB protein
MVANPIRIMSTVKPIPDGYHSVTPYLIVHDGPAALEFYQKAFGAEQIFRIDGPDGRIGHAEVRIGNSPVMFASEHPEMGATSPRTVGGVASSLMIYVENADAVTERAVAAGAEIVRPIRNQFYGDRSATVKDPFGHIWHIATHIEDVPPDEMMRRAKEAMGGGC